uniref:Dynein regulatory complex subunit 3 n=1 Tax=Scleropages formosus TaxID=113540 RepID=A0A8C9TD26_SCLFO
MSSVYDTVEPSVVDEEMLQKAVEEQGPQGQAGRIARDEGVQYHEVCQLCLDYRNILKIDHLWQFTSLTKLQLDNNIIEKIEGLERLTNLVWLDLSFNKIEVIEGLDTLVKLEDLSLYHNRISIIENMDSLQKLHVLSLGNNLLRDLDNVVYLRKFKNLRTLNLAGNPLCKESNYKVFIAAHFPELVYLDFRILDKQTVSSLTFAQCRDLENNHNERLQEIAVAALDKAAANELEEDMPEGEQLPFFDKDTVMNAVSASHDIHLLKIDKREDELVTRINSWMTVLMKSIQDAEGKRNRKRISEIHHYIDYVKTQLDEVTLHRTL